MELSGTNATLSIVSHGNTFDTFFLKQNIGLIQMAWIKDPLA